MTYFSTQLCPVHARPPGEDQCVANTCSKVLLTVLLNNLALSYKQNCSSQEKNKHTLRAFQSLVQRILLLGSSQVTGYLLEEVVLQLNQICQTEPIYILIKTNCGLTQDMEAQGFGVKLSWGKGRNKRRVDLNLSLCPSILLCLIVKTLK